jgi:hypothetical protein
MDERLPKIEHIISTVFIEALSLSTGVKHRRTRQVEREVRAFLEAEVDPYLTDDERILLAAERELEPNGAASRVLEAEVLIGAGTHRARRAAECAEPLGQPDTDPDRDHLD